MDLVLVPDLDLDLDLVPDVTSYLRPIAYRGNRCRKDTYASGASPQDQVEVQVQVDDQVKVENQVEVQEPSCCKRCKWRISRIRRDGVILKQS